MIPSDPANHIQFKPGDWSILVIGFFNLQVGEETLGLYEPCVILAVRVAC